MKSAEAQARPTETKIGTKIDPKMVPKWPPKGAPKLEPSWKQKYWFFVGFKSKNEESGAKGRKARVDTRKQNRSQMDLKMTLSLLSLLSSVFALSSLQRAKIAFGNGVRKCNKKCKSASHAHSTRVAHVYGGSAAARAARTRSPKIKPIFDSSGSFD